jgi:Flp pilus assembly protein TadG
MVSAVAFSRGVVEMRALRPARNREHGAIAVIMALCLTALMGFAALGFDLAYVRLARLEMKNASDAAAHAAILRLRSSSAATESLKAVDSRSAGEMVALANTVLGKPMTLQDDDFTFGTWDPSVKSFVAGSTPYTAVEINGVRETSASNDGYVQLTFGRALGYTESSVTEDTIGAFANRNFMIEMDVTPSYICDIDVGVQAAAELLVDLHTKNIGGDKISLDVFTGKSVELTGFLNIRDNFDTIYNAWWGGTYGSLYVSFLDGTKTSGIVVCNKSDDTGPAPKGGVFACPSGAANRNYPNYGWVQHCSEDGPTGYPVTLYAGTDIAAAITAGTNKLVANTQTWEPRVLIIVTDGSPMTCTGPGGGALCGDTYGSTGTTPPAGKTSSSPWDPCCADGLSCTTSHSAGSPNGATACTAATALKTAAVTAANTAAADNIDLFTIKVNGAASDTSTIFIESLARNHGTGNWLSSTAGLGALFTSIAGQVPVTLVK